MKVCQLCAVDFTLGRFLLPLIDGMRAAGWDVVAVCSDGPKIPALRERGYEIETVRIARSLNPMAHLRSLLKLVRLFRQGRYDVVHVHTPVAALLGRLAARMARVPLVIYTAHGFYFHDEMTPLRRRVFVTLEKIGGRWTDLLFTQSAEDASAAVVEKIAPADRVFAIGNGVAVSRFDPGSVTPSSVVRRSLGIPEVAFVIGMVGRQVQEKGVVEFLEAATSVATRHPRSWFLLVGERLASDHAGKVDDSVTRAKALLGDRLILTGEREDVADLMSAMNVFCLPSWREGMPRTIIEAMMLAKPVIATDIRGAREQVVADETGLLVPTRSPDELSRAMVRCLESPEWARRLGANGRRRALMHYDERTVVAAQIERIGAYALKAGLLKAAGPPG